MFGDVYIRVCTVVILLPVGGAVERLDRGKSQLKPSLGNGTKRPAICRQSIVPECAKKPSGRYDTSGPKACSCRSLCRSYIPRAEVCKFMQSTMTVPQSFLDPPPGVYKSTRSLAISRRASEVRRD